MCITAIFTLLESTRSFAKVHQTLVLSHLMSIVRRQEAHASSLFPTKLSRSTSRTMRLTSRLEYSRRSMFASSSCSDRLTMTTLTSIPNAWCIARWACHAQRHPSSCSSCDCFRWNWMMPLSLSRLRERPLTLMMASWNNCANLKRQLLFLIMRKHFHLPVRLLQAHV